MGGLRFVRKNGGNSSSLLHKNNNGTTKCCVPISKPFRTTSKLFRKGATVLVQRVSPCEGMVNEPPTRSALHRPFQRPMTKRRAYDQRANGALQSASLGARKRFDGMSNIALRAKKPLHFRAIRAPPKSSDTEGESDSEEEDDGRPKPPDQPYDPILLWTSPHNGGDLKGLPSVS